MLKRISRILFPIIAFLMVSSIVLASSWLYRFPTTAKDTSGATRTNVPVLLGYGGTSLVSSGKMMASGLDTNMQIGTSNVKYMIGTTQVAAVVPSLTANGNQRVDLYTGYAPAQTGFPVITGYNGYVTVSDNSDIEPAASFADEFSGYFDTSNAAAKYLLDKTLGQTTNGTALYAQSGNITGKIITTVNAVVYILPSGTGNYTDIYAPLSNANPNVAHYLNVQDPVGAPDDAATEIYTSISAGAGFQRESFNGTATSAFLGSSQIITAVKTHIRTMWDGVGTGGRADSNIVLNNILGSGTSTNPVANGVWTDYSTSGSIARPGGGTWTTADFTPDNLQILVGANTDTGTETVHITQVYVEVDYAYLTLSATVTGSVPSGTHVVKQTYDGANLKLYIDDMVTANATAAWAGSVQDNTNNFVLMSNATLYLDYFKHTVGGVEKIKFQPSTMIIGTALPNLDSGGSYPGVITFGTNSNITLTYGGMESYNPTSAVIGSQTGGFTMSTSILPSTWFSNGESLTTLPFYDSFSAAASSSGMPVDTIYTVMAIGLAITAFVLVTGYTRSAFLGSLSMVIVLFISSSMTIIPMWIPVAIMIVDFGIMFIYRQVTY